MGEPALWGMVLCAVIVVAGMWILAGGLEGKSLRSIILHALGGLGVMAAGGILIFLLIPS